MAETVVITCRLSCRSVTFILFFATRILRLFTPMDRPCSRFCVIYRSRLPLSYGLSEKSGLLKLLRYVLKVN